MRRLTLTLAVAALALLTLAPAAQAEFGLTSFEVGFLAKDGQPEREAGAHPYEVRTSFEVNTRVDPDLGVIPDEMAKMTRFFLPAGFIGSRTTVPGCATADFLEVEEDGHNHCSDTTAVGVVLLRLFTIQNEPVYNLTPPPGVAAKLGFIALNTPITVEVGINDAQPFNIVASSVNIPQTANFFGADLRLWGTPADHSHDSLRGRCLDLNDFGPDGEPLSTGDTCDTGSEVVPWLTMPRSCNGPLLSSYEAVSWQQPNAPPDEGSSSSPGMTGCSKLNLAAGVKAKPTVATAESASGLDFELEIKDEGLYNPDGPATQSDVKKAVVRLPAGMTVNPSSANGLAVCSAAGYRAESLGSAPGEGCPQAAKIGEVEVESPLLAEGETLHGAVFVASQDDNPFNTLIALYMVIKSPELGVLVKLPLKVEPNQESGPNAGRLVTTLDEAPQIPFSAFRFHFTEGARGPLLTPPACGAYATEAELTPWSDPANPITTSANFQVSAGAGGGACPSGGVPPFKPGFSAGSLNNSAGAYSPFNMRLTRNDGEQGMTRFDAVLPRGVLGKLAGIAKCPDSAIAVAKAKTGREELASPSCPASSEIGDTLAGAGVGSVLTYVPGKIYLGGPVGGAPLSVIAITPAVAGPFDVGTVVLREALTLDPKTAEVKVDGALSDPIPTALRGIVLKVKDVRVYTDRPNFTLNPTSCAKKEAQATLFGSFLDVFSPGDDVAVSLSDRYQAASCANLGFKPRLGFKLKGGTRRGGHPAFNATYTPRAGDANVKGFVVRLPRSAFLDQAHIRTICTRVQFAADACPKGAQYGFIKATTPLLDEPLEGPVYLRSSNHKLPDLVFDLHGLVDIEVATRIDSVKGGIRASIEDAPDAPLSKVLLQMQGAKKGLIVNSRNLCGAKSKANVELAGHNGKVFTSKPVMRADCGGERKSSR